MRRSHEGALRIIACAAVMSGTSLGATTAAASPSGASASTAIVNFVVTSTQPKPGDLALITTSGTLLKTCPGSRLPGSATCRVVVTIPSNQTSTGVVYVAQPSAGDAFASWNGPCAKAPDPVCRVQLAPGNDVTVKLTIVKAAAVPTATANTAWVDGTTSVGPGCGPSTTIIVTGAGFTHGRAATLTDDGHTVATGSTDTSGAVTLSYSAASEPGIYRNLIVSAAGHAAKTAVENSGFFCPASSTPSPGMVSFTITLTGGDANSRGISFQFKGQAAVPIMTDATGAGSVSTPAYSCPSGAATSFVLDGHRGGAGPSSYQFRETVPFSCP